MPWENLGSLAPSVVQWRTYKGASPLASGAAVFRVTPKSLSPGVVFRTYALVRFRSVQNGKEIITPARKVYPRPGTMVIDADIPREVRGSGVKWFPQVKKQVYRRFIGSTNDGRWLLEIEHLVRVNPPAELAGDNDTVPFADREDITVDITDVFGFD
jgi:hypothetical protein